MCKIIYELHFYFKVYMIILIKSSMGFHYGGPSSWFSFLYHACKVFKNREAER